MNENHLPNKTWQLTTCVVCHVIYIHVCIFLESATSSSLVAEDWGLNMEICDMVNGCEEGYALESRVLPSEFLCLLLKPLCENDFSSRPRDAVKAIKKRIVGNKNFKEVMLALTVSFVSCPACLVGRCKKKKDVVCCSTLDSLTYKEKTGWEYYD